MPYYFIRTPSVSGDKVLGPYEPFEVLQRAELLRARHVELVITDEDGKVVDEKAIARGDILSPRDEGTCKYDGDRVSSHLENSAGGCA
jgi:hypothetical protein